MLLKQVERIKRSKLIDLLLVATSVEPSDDQIAQLCAKHAIDCFRGSLEDVLDRFYQAVERHNPGHVVRITGDCPLIDPEIIDQTIELHLRGQYDYTSNCLERTYPHGLDVEVFTAASLEAAWREAALPYEREHVTPYLKEHPELFKIGSLKNSVDLSHLRWTVDYESDYVLVKRIYESLYQANPAFTTADILALLDAKPELSLINQQR
jgi:spore coat polysaccharide biosynthesis protein SpsF